jgi:Tripartite tricarboxylate transporter TctB family
MMPTLVIGLMIVFGLALVAGAGASPRLAEIEWGDFPHALRVVAIAAAATALYTVLGFILTMLLMLFGLIFAVERKRFAPAAAISIGVTLVAAYLFNTLLKSPLPQGILGF